MLEVAPLKQTVDYYGHVWKQHLTCCSESQVHCLIYITKALFNTSTRRLMRDSPQNTSALHAEV